MISRLGPRERGLFATGGGGVVQEGGERRSLGKERSEPSPRICSKESWRASPFTVVHGLREDGRRVAILTALPSPPLDLSRLLMEEVPVEGSLSLWRFLEASRMSTSSQSSTRVFPVSGSAPSSSEETTNTSAGGENLLCCEEWGTSEEENCEVKLPLRLRGRDCGVLVSSSSTPLPVLSTGGSPDLLLGNRQTAPSCRKCDCEAEAPSVMQ